MKKITKKIIETLKIFLVLTIGFIFMSWLFIGAVLQYSYKTTPVTQAEINQSVDIVKR